MLLSSKGASLLLQGDQRQEGAHDVIWLDEGAEYPGTLLVVEVPFSVPERVGSYEKLLTTIQNQAIERKPKWKNNHWLTFGPPPIDAGTVFKAPIHDAAQHTLNTQQLVSRQLLPRVQQGGSICLDFSGVDVLTQSVAHQLLYAVVREAFQGKIPIYITGANEPVKNTLHFLENYALRGIKTGK